MEPTPPPIDPFAELSSAPRSTSVQGSNPSHNPYAPPSTNVAAAIGANSDAEAIRRELLNHEKSIQSIGSLYGLSFIFCLLLTVLMPLVQLSSGSVEASSALIIFAIFGSITAIMFFLASGLKNLDSRIRVWATLFSCLGLLNFPLGTLFNGYILWLLHSSNGKRVMTPEYQDIVARTPHIRYITPMWLKIVGGLLLLLIVLGTIQFAAAFS